MDRILDFKQDLGLIKEGTDDYLGGDPIRDKTEAKVLIVNLKSRGYTKQQILDNINDDLDDLDEDDIDDRKEVINELKKHLNIFEDKKTGKLLFKDKKNLNKKIPFSKTDLKTIKMYFEEFLESLETTDKDISKNYTDQIFIILKTKNLTKSQFLEKAKKEMKKYGNFPIFAKNINRYLKLEGKNKVI